MGDPENSLHLDHATLRRSLNPKYFGPSTPREDEELLNLSRNHLTRNHRSTRSNHSHHNLRRQTGAHKTAPRPHTADSVGLDVSDLDFAMTKSSIATPWAHSTMTGAQGTHRGVAELKSEVLLRAGLRTNINASRAMQFDQARPYVEEFIRLREPPTREEIDTALDDEPDTDVENMTSARARRLINRLMKRYENQLSALTHHLEQRYGESPLPSKLPRRKEQAELSSRIALSQTYLKADMPAVQIRALNDKGIREKRYLDKQDLQHKGLVSGISGLAFGKVNAETVGATKAVMEKMNKMRRPDQIAQGRRVDKTLSMVHEAYFPPSRRWRSRQNHPQEPAHMRRVSRGSMVMFSGQGTAYRDRHHNEARHITQLRKQCVLGLDEINQIRQIVASLTDDVNPQISFSRFLSIMKAIGVGGGAAEGTRKRSCRCTYSGEYVYRYYTIFSISANVSNGSDDQEDESLTKEAETTQREGLRKYQVQRMILTLVQHLGGGGGGDGLSNDDLKRIFAHADADGDGDIDFEELYEYTARHPALTQFIAKSSIVFNSGLREDPKQEQSAGDIDAERHGRPGSTTFHAALVAAEDEEDQKGAEDICGDVPPLALGNQSVGNQTSASWGVDGSIREPSGRSSSSSSSSSSSGGGPRLTMDKRHTISTRRASGALMNDDFNRSRSLASPTLWEQRKVARQPAQQNKRLSGVRASCRSQGVTGFLAMGAKGLLSNVNFDETAERAAVEQRAEDSRERIVRGSHSTSMSGGVSLNQSRIAAPLGGSYAEHAGSFSSGAR